MSTTTKVITKRQLDTSLSRAKTYVISRLGDINVTVAEALDDLAGEITTKAVKPLSKTISIASSEWITNTDTAMANLGYQYYAPVTINGITNNHLVNADIATSSLNVAYTCRIAPYVNSVNGAIYFYAKKKPTVAISMTVTAMFIQ